VIRKAAILLLAAAAASAGEKRAAVAVHLEPVAEEAVQGLPVEKVEAALRQRLARTKGVTLVPSAEEATIVLRVSECLGWGEKVRTNEANERNIGVNEKGPIRNIGSEGVYGTRVEKRSRVSLVVRATWSGRFHDLQSADDDRSLKAAADTVADELARVVKRGLKAR